jgi:hypothetical protein
VRWELRHRDSSRTTERNATGFDSRIARAFPGSAVGPCSFLPKIAALVLLPCVAVAEFRAGAFSEDIAPAEFPVRVNAMFTERSADKVADPFGGQSAGAG